MRVFYILYRIAEMLGSLTSRAFNAFFLGGSTRQTTSARAHLEWPKAARIINAIVFWQDDHCESAWLAEVEDAIKTLDRAGYDVTLQEADA